MSDSFCDRVFMIAFTPGEARREDKEEAGQGEEEQEAQEAKGDQV